MEVCILCLKVYSDVRDKNRGMAPKGLTIVKIAAVVESANSIIQFRWVNGLFYVLVPLFIFGLNVFLEYTILIIVVIFGNDLTCFRNTHSHHVVSIVSLKWKSTYFSAIRNPEFDQMTVETPWILKFDPLLDGFIQAIKILNNSWFRRRTHYRYTIDVQISNSTTISFKLLLVASLPAKKKLIILYALPPLGAGSRKYTSFEATLL